jgi:ribosomal protein S18 acetylase RimI-like enzyme
MPEIRVEAASAVPWTDVEHALTGGGDGATCWCQWFLIPRAEFADAAPNELRELLRAELDTATRSPSAPDHSSQPTPSPGLLAYVDNEAAAWMRVAPRVHQPTLLRTRIVKAGSPEPLDDPDVWAITCFVVRREFRGLGLAKHLVAAGVEHAASFGARWVEAYPFDTDVKPRRASELFVGTTRLFSGQGFIETARPTEARVVMTCALESFDSAH